MTLEPKPYVVRAGLEGLEPEPPIDPAPSDPATRSSRADRLGRRPAAVAGVAAPAAAPGVPRARSVAGGNRLPTSTWLPARLAARVRDEYTARGVGAGELFKEAVEFSVAELPRLIRESIVETATPEPAGGLFVAPQPVTRPRAFHEPTVTVSYRMAKADQEILDELASKWGATSRGHLIGCALDHYFAHHNEE